MSLTIKDFEQGIQYWRGTNWDSDLHNDFYRYMAECNPNGNFDEWIRQDDFLDMLHRWRANRPEGKAFIAENIGRYSQELSDTWRKLKLDHDIGQLEWEEVEEFPNIVTRIKNVRSPVFTSKFCHFLAPQIFPVIDNKAMGSPYACYKDYYIDGRREWMKTPSVIQKDLERMLLKEVKKVSKDLYTKYPIKCKIIELCFIGRNNP